MTGWRPGDPCRTPSGPGPREVLRLQVGCRAGLPSRDVRRHCARPPAVWQTLSPHSAVCTPQGSAFLAHTNKTSVKWAFMLQLAPGTRSAGNAEHVSGHVSVGLTWALPDELDVSRL